MPLKIEFAPNIVGGTYFATLKRQSDGFIWNQTAAAWQSAPAAVDQKITLTEGTGTYVGSYTASVSGLGDALSIAVYIHDDVLATDAVIAGSASYIVGGNEVAPPT